MVRGGLIVGGGEGRCESAQISMHQIELSVGDSLVQAFFRSLALGGTTALIIQLLLSYALRQVIPQDGSVSPGLEFKHAYAVRDTHHPRKFKRPRKSLHTARRRVTCVV
jgi:hypothetical protein